MAFRKPNLESALVSAGELTLGELGSLVCDREESPRVNMLKLGRAGAAIVTDLELVKAGCRETFEGETKTWVGGRARIDRWTSGGWCAVSQEQARIVTLLSLGE